MRLGGRTIEASSRPPPLKQAQLPDAGPRGEAGRRAPRSAPLPSGAAVLRSRVAGEGATATRARGGAQRAQVRPRVGAGDEGEGSGMVLTVEGGESGETAARGVRGVVEPEPEMER